MSKGDPVTYEELTPEHKQKFDEIKAQYSASGPTLGSHKGELPFQTRPPLPYTPAAPESHGAPAYVV
jgi:hypothetical protein